MTLSCVSSNESGGVYRCTCSRILSLLNKQFSEFWHGLVMKIQAPFSIKSILEERCYANCIDAIYDCFGFILSVCNVCSEITTLRAQKACPKDLATTGSSINIQLGKIEQDSVTIRRAHAIYIT